MALIGKLPNCINELKLGKTKALWLPHALLGVWLPWASNNLSKIMWLMVIMGLN